MILRAMLLIPTLLLLLTILGCSTDKTAETASGDNIVNVYNWAYYIAPDTIEKFESEITLCNIGSSSTIKTPAASPTKGQG